METTIYLLRHAETIPNEVATPETWELSKEGKEQAMALKDKLKLLNIDVVLSSPFDRAVDTLRPYAAQEGITIHTVDDLRDQKVSNQYLAPAEFQELTEKIWKDDTHAEDGCESSEACTQRLKKAMGAIVKTYEGRTVLVCTHGQIVGLLLKDVDESFGYENWTQIRMPDIFRLIYDGNQGNWDKEYRFD